MSAAPTALGFSSAWISEPFPGRVGEEVAPHPSQIRTCRFPASGSSQKRFDPNRVRYVLPFRSALPRISCRTWWRWRNFMRLSLRKGGHVALSSDAWQEIRLRSGRDDKFVFTTHLSGEGRVNCRSLGFARSL